MGGIVRRVLGWARSRNREGRDQLALDDSHLLALMDQLEQCPTMGGKKGAGNLIHDEAALVGSGTYLKAKRYLLKLCGQELASRRATPKPPPPFEPPVAEKVNDVWGSDLFGITAWSKEFHICVYQDIVSQKRLCLEPTEGTADSAFVAACFDQACEEAGDQPPTVGTKSDRGSQYTGAPFKEALAGRCEHVLIPPHSPWFNGETEHGQRENRDLVYKYLHEMERPKAGAEFEAVREACRLARRELNERIARPSLGNVTSEEVVRGEAEAVRQRNRDYVARARAEREQRRREKRPGWRDRIAGLLDLEKWDTRRLLRLIRLAKRDYRMVTT